MSAPAITLDITATATADLTAAAQWVELIPPIGNQAGLVAHIGASVTGAPSSDGVLYFALSDGVSLFAVEKMDLINPAVAFRTGVAGATGKYFMTVAGANFTRFFRPYPGHKATGQGPRMKWMVGCTLPTGSTAVHLDIEFGIENAGRL